ncbi:MAG: response regulator [Planctomycetota bacterium]
MIGRVLVVDDSLTVRMDIQEALEEAGFAVELSADLAQARQRLEQAPCDAVVLDVHLPDGNGVDLVRELRADASVAELPVLLLSSRAEVQDRLRGMSAGAFDFVGKPYDRGYLVERVRELLQREAAPARPLSTSVLVVEDSLTFRSELRLALEAAGYRVFEASSAEEGLRVAARERPDLAVVDGLLGDEYGSTVIQQLRHDPSLRHIPCLLLTAGLDAQQELEVLAAGADAFVRKDLGFAVILGRLASLGVGRLEPGDRASLHGPKRVLALAASPAVERRVEDLRSEGYDAALARSGEDALALLGAQEVDVVLLDDALTGELDARETCRRIKASPVWRDIPVLTFLGEHGPEAVGAWIEAGADDCLPRQSEPLLVRARIMTQLRRKHFEAENRAAREARHRRDLLVSQERAARDLAEERRQRTEELRRKNDELERLNVELARREALAQDQRSAAQGRLARIVAGTMDGMWEHDLRRGTSYYSPSLHRLLGLDPERELLDPERMQERVHPDDREARDRALEAALSGRRPEDLEYRVRHADGGWRWLRSTGQVFCDEAGRPTYVAGSLRDITEGKRLERALQAAQRLEAVGRLAGGVAHDFNNMLSAILGFTDLSLRQLPEEHPARKHLLSVLEAAQRSTELTGQLLSFGRRQVLRPEVVDLDALLRGLETLIQRAIGARVALRLALGARGRAEVDPGQLEQVVINLAVNARDAMPEGGQLTIETQDVELRAEHKRHHPEAADGPHVLLAFSDTGHGMPREVLEQVFEPFFTTKPEGQGTGLGLASAHGFVKQSGGSIWVYSEVGQGTTFKIYLPRLPESSTAVPRPTASQGAPLLRGGETVLLVEDEDLVRELVRETLEDAGYRVLVAEDGRAGLALAEAHQGPLDLLLTDVVLPGLPGPELAAALRAARPDLLVLFSSGYAEQAIVWHGNLSEGVEFLAKPFTPSSLARRVREVLDGRARG